MAAAMPPRIRRGIEDQQRRLSANGIEEIDYENSGFHVDDLCPVFD